MPKKPKRRKRAAATPPKSGRPIAPWVFPTSTLALPKLSRRRGPPSKPPPDLEELLREVAAEFEKTRERIRQIEAKALARFRASKKK